MATITEDFCSYEVAKLLKEKGFDILPYHQYYVSKCGKVFGCKGDEIKQSVTNRGYKRITLSISGKEERWSVHRLVALLFVPNLEQKPQVNHIDGNKENNDASNLEWCTASENNKHAIRTGLRKNPTKGKFGKDHIASKPIVCVETGRVYNCQREVAEELGEDYKWTSHLSRACRYGLLDHGFHWRYYEPNELVKLLFEKGYSKYPLSYDGDYWFCYIQMAMKWLREVHGLHISLEPCYDYDSMHVVFLAFVQNVADVHEFFDGRKNVASYPNAEKSYELAIKYCLENLI